MLSIQMHDDGRIRMSREEEGQLQKVKYVAVQDLIEAFRDQTMSSPILPLGTIQYWRGPQHDTLSIYTPAHLRHMSLCGVEYQHMPIPATIFVFEMYRGEDSLFLGNSAVFVTTTEFRGPQTLLYKFPFGNVFDDCRICWGEVSHSLQSVYQAGSLVDLFLGSNFNTDLLGHFPRNLWENSEEPELVMLWRQVAGQNKFPQEWLLNVGEYGGIEDLLYFIRN